MTVFFYLNFDILPVCVCNEMDQYGAGIRFCIITFFTTIYRILTNSTSPKKPELFIGHYEDNQSRPQQCLDFYIFIFLTMIYRILTLSISPEKPKVFSRTL